MRTAAPQLETEDYYFVQQSCDYPWSYGSFPAPGEPAFSVTNTTPLLIAALGDSTFKLSGWARQRIVNGYAYKFAYLGQYFEKAYKIDFNGQITTNETGILSPYGEFTSLEPGPIALATMTNWGVNERGTAVVHVISMSVDGNRDGVMDASYTGPDATTWSRPFRFWVNDNSDSGEDGGTGIPRGGPFIDAPPGQAWNHVRGVRDLLDFFPVCLNIGSLLRQEPSLTIKLSQADSALYFVTTELAPEESRSFLTDTNIARSVASRLAYLIPQHGTALSSNFLAQIRDEGKGIILVEAGQATSAPLVLEVWRGSNLLASTSLHLGIDGVETMFRHKNLTLSQTSTNLHGPPDRPTDESVANEPDTEEKNFVFVHGYNVNANQARGWFADMYKRMFWSGSQAKFYGVTWMGAESQVLGAFTPNYHTNVCNAFLTSSNLANFFATLTNGPAVLAAHSLGNMACLSAISDWNAPVSKYFMIDAAVATEAIDASVSATVPMIHPDWVNGNYARRLWASSWYDLFPSGDGRNLLSWSNRLANLPFANIYNFYSSGEEVLRQYEAGPPLDGIGTVNLLVDYWDNHPPLSSYAWAWQEKGKGRSPVNHVLGSSHGGWKFNASYDTNAAHLPYTQANVLPNSQLQTNAFFDFVSGSFSADSALYGANASTYAAANRNRILADAIPALTLPIGANPVPILTPQNEDDQNFDMQALFENGWPSGRPERQFGAVAPGEWHHSDIREVAYTFTHPVFKKMIILGDLK